MALMIPGHTCGVLEGTNTPKCWGYNGVGQSFERPSYPLKAIVTGMRYSCGISVAGSSIGNAPLKRHFKVICTSFQGHLRPFKF